MTSACTNPVLYGFLNENFKKEFKNILNCLRRNKKKQNVVATSTTVQLADGINKSANVAKM